jgi:hypothetical protein
LLKGEFMEPEHPIAIFKGGDREHMEQLLKEGVVYMNTIGHFRKLELDSTRRDGHEGSTYCERGEGVTIRVKHEGEWREVGTPNGPIVMSDDESMNANIYCLHARTTRDFEAPFRLDLGYQEYVFIWNADEFFRRVRNEAERAGQRVDIRMVRYVDRKTYHGPLGPFRKFSEYSAQSELRILAQPGLGGPLILKLGNLSDIAVMVPAGRSLKLERVHVPG